MSFLSPLIKTLLVSTLLFFILVFLGMKYHWIGFNHNAKNIKLNIPKDTPVLGPVEQAKLSQDNDLSSAFNLEPNTEERRFQPQIIQRARPSSLVINMTKVQVVESCRQLLKKKIVNTDLLAVAVGNCVISNYRDSIIDIKGEEEVSSIKSNVLKACQHSVGVNGDYSNEIERQLLLGICVSGKLLNIKNKLNQLVLVYAVFHS